MEPAWLQQARERQQVRRQALMKQWAKRVVPLRGVKALIAEQNDVPLPDELQALVDELPVLPRLVERERVGE